METKRNLEQRLLAVRAAIPRLAPKKYSDQIKYKYNKISDIYEHLGPAMEANGVLLHVTGETATRRYEDGSPMFWQAYETRTKYGDARTLWIYESDITLEWSNADDPSDTRTVVIHALGTNDGGPDKAKGSAWTYALKYFLFEEMGIDQGEDDPDNRVEAPAPQPQRQAASGDVAQKLYDNGMNNFNKRNYSAAVRSFDDLTKTYPKNKLASNAWFWKGESYYQMKNYGQAALAYQNVIEGSPNSSKAPSSYLKQGMSFLQLNKGAAAKQRFNELIKKYPSSPEARRARQVMAENKL